jgi:hypothetical protein
MKGSQRTEVIEFLRRHVIGKAVVAPAVTTRLDRDQITAAYEEDAVFSNLKETANGFSFDLTTLARGTRYVQGKDGKLLAEGTLNAVRVIRYEITERRSSGRLVGFARFVASTNTQPDPFSGTVFLVQLTLERDVLSVAETMVGYADAVSADGTLKPVAWDGKYRYALEDGTLVVRYDQSTFDVDPATLGRTPTKETFATQVSREIQFPAELVKG